MSSCDVLDMPQVVTQGKSDTRPSTIVYTMTEALTSQTFVTILKLEEFASSPSFIQEKVLLCGTSPYQPRNVKEKAIYNSQKLGDGKNYCILEYKTSPKGTFHGKVDLKSFKSNRDAWKQCKILLVGCILIIVCARWLPMIFFFFKT